MNNSLVKLEDFQLDQISGGITAKQVGAYAIKGTLSATLGIVSAFVSKAGWQKLGVLDRINSECAKASNVFYDKEKYMFWNFGDNRRASLSTAQFLSFLFGHLPLVLASASLTAAGGWKLGEWLCKKIGLED